HPRTDTRLGGLDDCPAGGILFSRHTRPPSHLASRLTVVSHYGDVTDECVGYRLPNWCQSENATQSFDLRGTRYTTTTKVTHRFFAIADSPFAPYQTRAPDPTEAPH